jgi:hypothetical protein
LAADCCLSKQLRHAADPNGFGVRDTRFIFQSSSGAGRARQRAKALGYSYEARPRGLKSKTLMDTRERHFACDAVLS